MKNNKLNWRQTTFVTLTYSEVNTDLHSVMAVEKSSGNVGTTGIKPTDGGGKESGTGWWTLRFQSLYPVDMSVLLTTGTWVWLTLNNSLKKTIWYIYLTLIFWVTSAATFSSPTPRGCQVFLFSSPETPCNPTNISKHTKGQSNAIISVDLAALLLSLFLTTDF